MEKISIFLLLIINVLAMGVCVSAPIILDQGEAIIVMVTIFTVTMLINYVIGKDV
jgi:hypothetical protein